jgi:RHS repeat-associated protein
VTKIEDTYAYNGDGLRTSQTISGTTTYLAWDFAEKLPLILNDATNSYIYGPDGLPIEQINNTTSTVLYLHHDQQGSTRLLTSNTGTKEASFTYDAYGNKTGSTGTATTPLGYDAQYTNADTGLIYLRARSYDPATGQFISDDPQVMETQAPYAYASDNPLSIGDPTGLTPWSPKVKQAIAQCRAWKNWHSYKSPYYAKQHGKPLIYNACQNLLSAGSEVPGTSSQAREIIHGAGEGVVAVTDAGCKQWLVGPGIPAAFAFRGALSVGTAACGGWVIGRAIDSVVGIE